MLVPINQLIDNPILSLQTGAELARTQDVIVDPRRLVIPAIRVHGSRLDNKDSVLHPEDIREISDIGMIIDDSDKLMSTEGLVRLQEVIDFGFVLPGISVIDDQGKKIGTVKDYSVDPENFSIQQLYIKPPFIKSIGVSTLTVHRSQVISVDNRKIVVKSPTIKEDAKQTLRQPAQHQASFVNPFRNPTPTRQERE